jgi:1-acyl-sn-glycerol-3-phosphate acyltransferase
LPAEFGEDVCQMNLGRSLLYTVMGAVTYPFLGVLNRLRFSGAEHLRALPHQNVLFVSNHQTYFSEVITLLHVFAAVQWGRKESLGIPFYLLAPFTRVNYVAAEQTMNANWVARFLKLGGVVTVKRTWNAASKEVNKGLDSSGTRNILRALEKNWVITFPQGTTTPFAPGRKGTATMIKQFRPIVVPLVIEGFDKAFEQRKLGILKLGSDLSVRFKAPLDIRDEDTAEEILARIMSAIEQDGAHKAMVAAAS